MNQSVIDEPTWQRIEALHAANNAERAARLARTPAGFQNVAITIATLHEERLHALATSGEICGYIR